MVPNVPCEQQIAVTSLYPGLGATYKCNHAEYSTLFNVHGFVHRNNILIYVQQDATLHSLFIWKLLYMFRVVPPPIIRSANNCISASGICHTVTVTCRYSGR